MTGNTFTNCSLNITKKIMLIKIILLLSYLTILVHSAAGAEMSVQNGLPRHQVGLPGGGAAAPITLKGARNENLFLIFSLPGVKSEDLQVDLQQNDRAPSLGIRVFLLRPVPANQFSDLLADGLVPLERGLRFAGPDLQILVSIKIPPAHPAGTNRYTISIRDKDKRILQPLELQVWRFSLPDDLPVTIMAHFRPSQEWFRRYGVNSPEAYDGVIETYLSAMRAYKINAIAGFYPLPLDKISRGQSLQSFPRFTRMLDLVVNKFGYRFFRIPSESGSKASGPDVARLRQLMSGYFPKMIQYLQGKGWLEKATVKLWDEPKRVGVFPRVAQVYGMFKAAFPQIRTESAGWPPPVEVAKVVNIWSVGSRVYDADQVRAAQQQGEEIWLYANNLHGVDRLPAHQRLIGWHLYRYGFKGYYLWGVNVWTEDPWTTPPDKYFRRGTFFYPNPANGSPWPTLRLEALRSGFQDFQYLTLLNTASAQGKVKAQAFQEIQQAVAAITKDLTNINPRANWMEMEALRLRMGKLLDQAAEGSSG